MDQEIRTKYIQGSHSSLRAVVLLLLLMMIIHTLTPMEVFQEEYKVGVSYLVPSLKLLKTQSQWEPKDIHDDEFEARWV